MNRVQFQPGLSMTQFLERYGSDDQCEAALIASRWPRGFDGTREPLFGPNPQGQASFDSDGRYILMTARIGQAKFTSTNRMEGTAEEGR